VKWTTYSRLRDPRTNVEKGSDVSKEPLIAVIDDDQSFRVALAESLLSLGYETREFASVEEFMAGDGEALCDCVITDVHMPGISGLDLKHLLAAQGSNVPVIMVTAHAEPDLEVRAVSSGAVCLLRKPFKTDALIECLERALKL
jgi:FixJ family two-component response regulator